MEVLLTLVVGLLVPPKEVKTDEKALQGTWVVVSGLRKGKPCEDVKDARFIFKNNSVSIRRAGEADTKMTYRLDASKSPRTIDVTAEGRVNQGIYELRGDVLKLCLAGVSSKKRPAKFSSEKGELKVLIELKREKK